MDPRQEEKRAAARAAAELVEDGMVVGLGTGSTAAHFLPALARRDLRGLRCVATSEATDRMAREIGLPVEPFERLDHLDIAVDGADQVSGDLWLVKGGGGAHTREKIVAAAADRFLVIVSEDKLVDRVHAPIPLELLAYGLGATLRHLRALGPAELREAPPTPDGNVLADFGGEITDPAALSDRLAAIPGVIDHGLFPPSLVSEVIVGRADGSAQRRAAR